MHDSFAEIVIHAESTKHPSTTVEVDISCSFLGLALAIELWCWLKHPNGDLTSFHGAFLLCDAKDIGAGRVAVGDGIAGRVLSKLLYWYFVRMETTCVETVVIGHINWIISGNKLWWNAIV